mgnify:FL=1
MSGKGIFFLIDLFEGEIDLKNGLIRVLHDQSFVDDPCRIFRAIRFEQRFEFIIEDQTQNFIRSAVKINLIDQLSRDRFIKEIKILLNEVAPIKCVDRMRELSLFDTIVPEILKEDFHWAIMKNIEGALALADKIPMPKKPEAWFVYFHAMLMVKNGEVFEGMMKRLNLAKNIDIRLHSAQKCFIEAISDFYSIDLLN